MQRLSLFLSLFALVALFAAGCSAPASAGPAATATASRPAQATATLSAPATAPVSATKVAPAQPAASGQKASFNGVSFSFNPSLAQRADGSIVPAQPRSPDGPFWEGNPAYTEFKFKGYALGKTFHEPRLAIFSVKDYVAANPDAAKTFEVLEKYLNGQGAPADGGMPFPPIFNAAQVFHAQVKNVEFAGGSGVRYLTQFDQAAIPINNFELFYTYQGLTKDGKYYVLAILPASSPLLPADDKGGIEGDFVQYVKSTTQKLDAEAAANFTPDLGLLDAMIQSLEIKAP